MDTKSEDQASVTDDPIVAETVAARRKLFEEAGNDLAEFMRRLRKAEAESGETVLHPVTRSDDDSAA